MTEMPPIDAEDDALRTAVAFCRAIALADGQLAGELWTNLTINEQTRVAVSLANLANSHATVILAATLGIMPSAFTRTMLAEHLTVKLQSLAAPGPAENTTAEES
jgi:hypothetical protein